MNSYVDFKQIYLSPLLYIDAGYFKLLGYEFNEHFFFTTALGTEIFNCVDFIPLQLQLMLVYGGQH